MISSITTASSILLVGDEHVAPSRRHRYICLIFLDGVVLVETDGLGLEENDGKRPDKKGKNRLRARARESLVYSM